MKGMMEHEPWAARKIFTEDGGIEKSLKIWLECGYPRKIKWFLSLMPRSNLGSGLKKHSKQAIILYKNS